MGCGASAEPSKGSSCDATANSAHRLEVGPISPSTAVAPSADSRAGTNPPPNSSNEEYRRTLLVSPQSIGRACEVAVCCLAPHQQSDAAPDSGAKSLPCRDQLLRCGRSHDGDGVLQELHPNDRALLTFVQTQPDVCKGKKSSDTARPALPNPHQSSIATEGVWQYSVMSGGPDSAMNAGSLAGYRGSGFAESGIVVDSTTLRGASRTDTLMSGASGNVESDARAKNGDERPLTLAKFYAVDEL